MDDFEITGFDDTEEPLQYGNQESDYFTAKEIEEHLGISQSTRKRWVNRGKLEAKVTEDFKYLYRVVEPNTPKKSRCVVGSSVVEDNKSYRVAIIDGLNIDQLKEVINAVRSD